MQPTTTNPHSNATLAQYETCTVHSKDGTSIGYRKLGRGPGLVLVHGAMESAASHMQLAEALAEAFSVYLLDRRGRGLSGPYGPDFGARSEVEDLQALLTATDAHFVFGVSAGGLICLEAALALPAIRKIALYEPVLSIDNSVSTSFVTRLDAELAQGRTSAALVTGMQGAQMGPAVFNLLPRWLLETLTNTAMKSEDQKAAPGDVTMRALAPTLHYDFQLVIETRDTVENYRTICADVLLLGGSQSPAYLKTALDALHKVFPHAERIEFPGVGHGASGNTERGGKPDLVARELLHFFA